MTRLVGYTLCALIVALTIAALADKARLRSLANAEALTWRQAAIIDTRAKVHGCQDRLGLHRSPVAQRIVTGGPAYRAYVLNRIWRPRLRLCVAMERQLGTPTGAIRAVFGSHANVAVRVARCESGLNPRTVSKTGDYGLFAINRAAHDNWVDFRRIFDPLYNARIAFRLSRGGTDFWTHWHYSARCWA